jgi:hypothetical protein
MSLLDRITIGNDSMIYLVKCLNKASRGNFKFIDSQQHGMGASFLVVKCKCGQNLHVSEHLFFDPTGNITIPTELASWILDHKHVCKTFSDHSAGCCGKCNWPYSEHEESWNKVAAPVKLVKEEDLQTQYYSIRLRMEESGMLPSVDKMKLPSSIGRKFR